MHSCDNPSCCNPDHLNAGTHKDNMEDRATKRRSAHGVRNGGSKLLEDEVVQIRANTELTQAALATKFNVSISAIERIITKTTWRYL